MVSPLAALPSNAATAAPRKRRWRYRSIVRVVFLGLSIALALEVVHVLFNGNIHEVIPGRVYRSAQLSPEGLRSLIEKRGIRTVINLRGCCNPFDWYLDECRIAHDLNVSQEDITLSANRLPPPLELGRLIDVLDHTEYPIVFHCRQGADRTGLASTVSMLLHTDADLATARKQCSIRYAHFEVLSTANMDRFFDLYENWLKQNGRVHTPDQFRAWARNEYRPDPAPARIELLGEIAKIPLHTPVTLTIRAHNLSNAVWEFKTGTFTGVHVRTVVHNPEGALAGIYRAGRFDARVAPGESIDIPLALPPFHTAGNHRLVIDLVDHHLNFCQLGSEFLELELPVANGEK